MRISWMRTVKPLRFLFRGARISAALSERFELYIKIARPCGRREPRTAAPVRRRLRTGLNLTAPNRGRRPARPFPKLADLARSVLRRIFVGAG
jgi:hypothetical protein